MYHSRVIKKRKGEGSRPPGSCRKTVCSYFRLIDFVYHSTLGVRVIQKKKKKIWDFPGTNVKEVALTCVC